MKKYFLSALFLFVVICYTGIAFSQDAEYFYNKANANLSAGKMQEAIKNYNQALKNNNSFFEAYIGLSIAYREIGQYDNALEAINYAININPEYYQAYYNKGLILEKQNKCDEALEAYEKFQKEVKGAVKFSDVKQRINKIKNSCGR